VIRALVVGTRGGATSRFATRLLSALKFAVGHTPLIVAT
jgi:hypothetical protein